MRSAWVTSGVKPPVVRSVSLKCWSVGLLACSHYKIQCSEYVSHKSAEQRGTKKSLDVDMSPYNTTQHKTTGTFLCKARVQCSKFGGFPDLASNTPHSHRVHQRTCTPRSQRSKMGLMQAYG